MKLILGLKIRFLLGSGLPWSIWRQHNDTVFIVLQWSIEKTHQVIWDASQD
jgi:hypothetical protein